MIQWNNRNVTWSNGLPARKLKGGKVCEERKLNPTQKLYIIHKKYNIDQTEY